jgi:antitoxin component of MazEF toxin-antitoxin module
MGSSLAITLPAFFVKVNDIQKGSKVEAIYGLKGVIIITKLKNKKEIKNYLLKIIENMEDATKSQ